MNVVYGIKLNPFYLTLEELFGIVKYQNLKSNFSKKMYGNHKLMFLVLYKEKTNMSWDRFIEHANEINLPRQLCLKKMPVKSTLIKFVKRTSKTIFEEFVKACYKILKIKNMETSIDGTGFSNTNPSHYYRNRINADKVKNFTKTIFLVDNKTKLILNTKTTSNHAHEINFFKPCVQELQKDIKLILADKGYDSMELRNFCNKNQIELHIPFKTYKKNRLDKPILNGERRRAEKKFDKTKYNQRSIVESINSAIKRTLGAYVNNKKTDTQQKQVTIKAITYNIEHINRILKITIQITLN
jgi:transposase